jgi:hypothetical protein
MARGAKYKDKLNLGRSRLVPYNSIESAAERHARRLQTSSRFEAAASAWARRFGIKVKISNRGHHWRFVLDSRIAEWWPSSAKLVLNKDYAAGIYAHDFLLVKKFLEDAWGLQVRPESNVLRLSDPLPVTRQ